MVNLFSSLPTTNHIKILKFANPLQSTKKFGPPLAFSLIVAFITTLVLNLFALFICRGSAIKPIVRVHRCDYRGERKESEAKDSFLPSSSLEKTYFIKIEIFNELPGSMQTLIPIGRHIFIVSRGRVCVQLFCLRNDLIVKIRWALRVLVMVGALYLMVKIRAITHEVRQIKSGKQVSEKLEVFFHSGGTTHQKEIIEQFNIISNLWYQTLFRFVV